MEQYGQPLAAFIEARELTQEKAALFFGVTQATICRWQQGRDVRVVEDEKGKSSVVELRTLASQQSRRAQRERKNFRGKRAA